MSDRHPRIRRTARGYRHLTAGGVAGVVSLGTGAAWLVLALAALPGAGRRAWGPLSRWTAALAARERERAEALTGTPLPSAFAPVTEGGGSRRLLRRNLGDRGFRRTLAWLPAHGFLAPVTFLLAVGQPFSTAVTLLVSGRWLVGNATGGARPYSSSFFFTVDSAPLACTAMALDVALTLLIWTAVPWFARLQARLAHTLLSAHAKPYLADRVQELAATRAAALEAHGAELRRIERDLHDGAQARMAAVVLQLGVAEQTLERSPEHTAELIRRARDTATDSLSELRGVVRSIYPPILSDRGLRGAVSALAGRCPIPCSLRLEDVERAPAAVEAAAYFIIAESLTNVAKHSGAGLVTVRVRAESGRLRIRVSDDGRGGAEESAGTGLAGIRRRAEAFDGRVRLTSPAGGPTTIEAELPCAW
ncbi:sensor histidine kinase [Streptomyces cacaoi]|uniref:sensor histidine kinase n=1 Tax=Streptomyces cacaoi TaxID=1898 RepID=UPI00333159BB